MSKQIHNVELAEIVTTLLVAPDIIGELDSTERHQEFMRDIAEVVAQHCGGHINGVSKPDEQGNYLRDDHTRPFVSVSQNDSLPNTDKCVWGLYDPSGWEDDSDVSHGDAYTENEALNLRHKIMGLLATQGADIESFRALVLSTGHMSQEDNDFLQELSKHNDRVMARDHGFVLKLRTELDLEDEFDLNDDITNSDALKHVLKWAVNHGYTMIEFDCDAETIDALPVFDW